MVLFPAIDIKDAQCVRLVEGDFATVHKVSEDAFLTAENFSKAGATHLHMVDLDGAKDGVMQNAELIVRLAKAFKGFTEVGGGIRTMEAVSYYIENGVDRVILGSAALQNKAFLAEALAKYGSHIAVGIDARDEKVCVAGWVEQSQVQYLDFAKECENMDVTTLIFTDISKDGKLAGPNFEALAALQQTVSCNITASGGVTTLQDVEALAKMSLYGAIIGKAIYAGTLNLKDAIQFENK